jgi:membrane associated rhomboid family serine protease
LLIPLSTDRPLARPTLITYGLIAVCVGVHLARAFLMRVNPSGEQWLHDFGVLQSIPAASGEAASAPRWWQFFTYQFLHGDFLHLLGNMVFLFVFGPAVEDRLRRWGFLAFYLLGGAFAGVTHLLFSSAQLVDINGQLVSAVPGVIGASGAIACVTGAYLVLFPLASIRVLLFFFVIGVYHLPAWLMIVFAVAKDIWSSAWTSGTGGAAGVAFEAHLGGYFYGATVAFLLLAFKVLPREVYDLFSMGKQAHRRRVFKELASSGKSPWLSDAKSGVTKAAARAAAVSDAKAEQIAALRSRATKELAAGNPDAAAATYTEALELDPECVLSRAAQSEIASHYHKQGKHTLAAQAFELLLKRYPTDREVANVRLMLAAINARYLNDPVRAKALIIEAKSRGLDETHAAFAESLLKDLG